jgi:hypothetical protein
VVGKKIDAARATVRRLIVYLQSGVQTLDQIAGALELEAQVWALDVYHTILNEVALQGVPPDQFEDLARDSAKEISALAIDEFSVLCDSDAENGVTVLRIGTSPMPIRGQQPKIDTRGRIRQNLERSVANYPQQYRRQNSRVYKLTRVAGSVGSLPLAEHCREESTLTSLAQQSDTAGASGVSAETARFTLSSGLDFTSETGRNLAVDDYKKRWTVDQRICSEASLARTAKVDPADLSKWKKGLLPAESDKKARIEAALSNNSSPTPATRRDSDT